MLTNENYFSPENSLKYMGVSQFKSFQKCEAAALAEIRGDYRRPSSTALLVGSYIDAHFEGTLDLFRAQHPELFKRDGGLKSDYVQAEQIINRLEADELFMMLMAGRKQVILTGDIAGVPYKIKIDSFLDGEQCRAIVDKFPQTAEVFGFCDGAIVDGKIMRDMADVWSPTERVYQSFAESWGYDIQGAVYQAVEGNMLPFILAVGTKETATDRDALHIPDGDLAEKLALVEQLSPRYQAIKEGRIEPDSCGKCAYCRSVKKLTRIKGYKDGGLC